MGGNGFKRARLRQRMAQSLTKNNKREEAEISLEEDHCV